MKVIAYTRLSKGERRALGLEAQRTVIEAECERRGWQLDLRVEIQSAARAANRAVLQQALRELERGDALMVAKLDVIARLEVCFAPRPKFKFDFAQTDGGGGRNRRLPPSVHAQDHVDLVAVCVQGERHRRPNGELSRACDHRLDFGHPAVATAPHGSDTPGLDRDCREDSDPVEFVRRRLSPLPRPLPASRKTLAPVNLCVVVSRWPR
jgi:hypothetical protein